MQRITLGLLLLVLAGCTKLEPRGSSEDAMTSTIMGDDAQVADAGEDDASIDASIDGGEVEAAVPDATQMGGDGGVMVGTPCPTPDALRCGAGTGQRERCVGGVWSNDTACPEGQVCTSDPAAGSCQSVAEVCRGSASQSVCDGNGIMYACDAAGVVTAQTSCASQQLCQLGLSGNKCLTCVPDSYRCTGATLERCKPDGSDYATVKTCASEALCKPSVGDCTDVACLPNTYACQSDVLRKCNAAQTGYEDVKSCKAGLCDAANGQCDECSAGAKSCDEDKSVTCSADGQTATSAACPSATPQCIGLGRCAQCAADADCPDPGGCKTRRCNLATGMCEPQNRPARSTCATGLCDGSGSCRACLATSDCSDPGACKTAFCNLTSFTCAPKTVSTGTPCGASGYCDSAGACVGCTQPDQCPASGECREPTCGSGTCGVRNKTAHTSCSNGVCNGSGTCQGCVDDSDCVGKPGGKRCSATKCVPCTQDGDCNQANHEICSNNACKVGPYCGDRIVNQASEECDDGNTSNGDACVNCKKAVCGDGQIYLQVEFCDPGATSKGWNLWNCSRPDCQPSYWYIACADQSDCGSELICLNGRCTKECTDLGQCPPVPTGNGSTGCGFFCLNTCMVDSDCAPFHFCTRNSGQDPNTPGFCAPKACSQGCPSGTTCSGSYCVPN